MFIRYVHTEDDPVRAAADAVAVRRSALIVRTPTRDVLEPVAASNVATPRSRSERVEESKAPVGIEERITKLLKMGDTGFEVSADKKARGAKPMKEGPKNELPSIPDVTEKFTWRSGGGGMVSTAADYARFLQMFANGGQLDGVRLISRKSIDLMTADALPPDIKMGAGMQAFEALEPSARMGQGFGLGFAVRTDQGRNPLPGSPGDYYWGGAYGTYFWHDPRERMYVVFMMQSPAARLRYRYLLRDLVYQALIGN
jgi:CubicO group peptidase (beta-lactamase class C family)